METPPAASAGGGAETLAAAEEKAEKRARKRSRYLSSDYDTAILIGDDDDAAHEDDIAASPRKGQNEDAAALPLRLQEANVATADLLDTLLRSAASPCDCVSPVPDAGVLIPFLALHRASVLAANCEDTTTKDQHHSKVSAAAPAVNRHGLPNPCGAMAVADGSAGKKQEDAIAMGHAHAADHTTPANAAAAAEEAGRKRKKNNKVAFALDGTAAAGSSAQAQPATSIADGTNSVPKKAKKKNARRSSVQGQHHPGGKPVALLLDLVPGGTTIVPPSKEELISTFRGFGSLIESETDIGTRRARLVFQSSAAAEAAYSCAHTLGTVTAPRLQYLRPRPPAPMIPLTDMKKNLEKMISSLTAPSVLGREGALDLAGQMMQLMAKVDKTLSHAGPGPSTATAHHH